MVKITHLYKRPSWFGSMLEAITGLLQELLPFAYQIICQQNYQIPDFQNGIVVGESIEMSHDQDSLDLYSSRLEKSNSGHAKAPGLNDRKWVNIRNMNPLAIIQPRGFGMPRIRLFKPTGV